MLTYLLMPVANFRKFSNSGANIVPLRPYRIISHTSATLPSTILYQAKGAKP